jgi:pyruvate oxidase
VDRAPLLAIAGQVDTQVLGPGAFQEVNLIGAFNDVSAFNHTVYGHSKHGELVSLAMKNAVIAADVGNNTYSFGRYFETSGEQAVLMSGYLGSIGFGYPAAMGAWAATQEEDPRFRDRPVWVVSGDGGFGQYMVEVLTAVKYHMNLTHVLLHNDELYNFERATRSPFPGLEDWPAQSRLRRLRESKLDEALADGRDYAGPATFEIMTDALLI